MQEFFESIRPHIFSSTLPGAAGGLVSFLAGLRVGNYKNNLFGRKCVLEIVGAMLTASFLVSFLSLGFAGHDLKIVLAFAIGVGWAGIIQKIRIS